MKRLILLIALISCTVSASAQRLVAGEKAPKLTVSKYIYGGPTDKGRPVLVEFFVSSGSQSHSQIETLSAFADKYRGKIDVVLVSGDDEQTTRAFFSGEAPRFSVAIDAGGKSFADYGVRYVPFAVLADGRGGYVWQGRSKSIPENVIASVLR